MQITEIQAKIAMHETIIIQVIAIQIIIQVHVQTLLTKVIHLTMLEETGDRHKKRILIILCDYEDESLHSLFLIYRLLNEYIFELMRYHYDQVILE